MKSPTTKNCQYILLADDDEDDCRLFKEAIDELGICVKLITVENGEQLMQLLNKEEPLPDILFLDLNMPRKNGIECLSEIKQSQRLKNLPVIIYSTSFQKSTVELLYQQGAQFYIRKPSTYTELKQFIQDALSSVAQLRHQQPPIEGFVLANAIL